MDASFFTLGTFCENQFGNHFIKQPLNLITSFAFFIAAFMMYRLLKTKHRLEPVAIVLLILAIIVGVSNFLMHLVPNPYFYFFDVGSLFLFFFLGGSYALYFKHIHLRELIFLSFLLGISIIFKYLDTKICHLAPFGTHFLLHISIPLAMYKLTSFIQIDSINKPQASA